MGWIGCFSCEKFQFDIVAWTFAPALSRFAPSFVRQSNSPKCTQRVENRPKHEFRLQWGGSGAYVAKNSDGTSWHEVFHQFDRFTLSVVTQPNSPKCTQIIRNTPKHEFRVNGVDRVRSLWNVTTRLCGTNFCTSSSHFPSSFASQPNGPKCLKIVLNMQKHEFSVQWGGSVRLLRKIPMRLHGTNFCTSSTRFAPSFLRQPNVPNALK